MIRDERYKYIAIPEEIEEFYDLDADPDETSQGCLVAGPRRAAQKHAFKAHRELISRGDKFYQWLAFAGDIDPEEWLRPKTALERFVTR